jgi:DNA repair ATPase RecN
MSMFENFTEKVTKTAKAAARKSGEIMEITKLNISIGIEEDKISKSYTEIGRLIYQSCDNEGNVPEDIKDFYERIKTSEQNIKNLKQKIRELKNVRVCENYDQEIDDCSIYCPKCGTKQSNFISQEYYEEKNQDICSNCSKPVNNASSYCSFCGTKIGK